MKVLVKWTTSITYERPVEIDWEEYVESGADDIASYVNDNADELLADYEEDFDDGLLTADVGEREIDEVTPAEHVWQNARLTGTRTCEKCGLLPLDEDDDETPCPETRDR